MPRPAMPRPVLRPAPPPPQVNGEGGEAGGEAGSDEDDENAL